MILKSLLVFAAMFALDYFYAVYTAAITARLKLASSTWATLIIVTTGFVTTNYVEDKWMLIPAALGAFVGTWAAVWWESRTSSTPDEKVS